MKISPLVTTCIFYPYKIISIYPRQYVPPFMRSISWEIDIYVDFSVFFPQNSRRIVRRSNFVPREHERIHFGSIETYF